MKLVYAGNWFALGACIYGRKSPDEALRELGLRKPYKRRLSRTDAVRKRLLNAGVKLERLKYNNRNEVNI